MRSILGSTLILFAIVGCSDAGTEVRFLTTAATDKTTYALREDIVTTISNAGDGIISLQTCCQDKVTYYVDILESDTWVP